MACNDVISRQSVMSIMFLAARKYFNLKGVSFGKGLGGKDKVNLDFHIITISMLDQIHTYSPPNNCIPSRLKDLTS